MKEKKKDKDSSSSSEEESEDNKFNELSASVDSLQENLGNLIKSMGAADGKGMQIPTPFAHRPLLPENGKKFNMATGALAPVPPRTSHRDSEK